MRAVVAGVALCTLSIAGCGSDDENAASAGEGSQDPWNIAVLTDLSGPLKVYGTGEVAGLKTYVEHVNGEGGVHGRPIELDIKDDRSDVQAGSTEAKALLRGKPQVLLGPFLSNLNAAIAPEAARAKVPQIGWSPVTELLEPQQDYIYAGIITLAQSARIQADVIADLAEQDGKSGALNIAIARLDSAAGEEFFASAKQEIESRGWKLVEDQKISTTATDVSDQATAIAKRNADYCLCAIFGPTGQQLVEGLRNAGSKLPIVTYYGGGFASSFEALNDPDYYAVLPFADPTDPNLEGAQTMRDRADAAGQEDGMAGYPFTQGYVAGMVVHQTLEQCGSDCTPEKFNETLKSIDEFETDGLSGPASFTSSPYLAPYGKAFHMADGKLTSLSEDWTPADE